jgi:macrolide transport system ATP-binding/permease protein
MTVDAAALRAGDAQASTAPLIALRGILRGFTRGGVELRAVDGVDLDIRRGEFVAFMGPSGCGKTTLMNLLGLLDRPSSGSYRFDGEEVSGLDADARATLRRDRFGFVFQHYNLLGNATALENVELPAIYAGRAPTERRARAIELLTMLGLGERLDHRPSQLSGGQQQRVSIARALMNGGEVILADEPTGALDSASGAEVMRLLRELHARGHTIILITHDRDVARQADRVIEMRDGRVTTDSGTASRAATPGFGPPHRAGAPRWTEILLTAVRALRLNLFRTALTLLGIVIGVASVVAMLSLGAGARQRIVDQITAMGPDLLVIRSGARNVRTLWGSVPPLTDADRLAIAALPSIRDAISEYPANVTARAQGNDFVTQANATTPNFAAVRSWALSSGVFFTEEDDERFAAVAVLGATVVANIFGPGQEPLGEWILLNNVPFQVSGVLAPRGATSWGMDQDDIVLIPLATGRLRLHGQTFVRSITAQIADVTRMEETQAEVEALLASRRGQVDFQVRNTAAILAAATASQDTMTLLLGSIALISLLVGGIGVMNIMLVSVTERTREIGVRMATGARPRDILLQFNAEALAVCAVGGLVGVGIGIGAAFALQAFGHAMLLTAGPVLLAFACAFLTGLVFGHLPARKAAGLDPVAALASE